MPSPSTHTTQPFDFSANVAYILKMINVQLLSRQATRLYNSPYFQYIALSLTLITAFFIGRLFHEKKFSNLINMIKDVEKTRKTLQKDVRSTQQSIRYMEQKKYLAIGVLLVILMSIGMYTYHLADRINILLLLKVSGVILLIVVIMWLTLRYLKWKLKSLDKKYKQSTLTTENQIKEILAEIGPDIAENLKYRFERQIDDDKRNEQLKQCDLNKCINEKRSYNKLNSLYKDIIAQMTKFNWCQVCSTQSNINILDLKIHEFKNNLAMYQKLTSDPKFLQKTEKQKELINRMLQDWSHMEPKLQFICRRGCCIKFRQLTEKLKKRHYESLNNLKTSLKGFN